MLTAAPPREPLRHFNIGAPMGRSCTAQISSTLLNRRGSGIWCPLVLNLALDFGDADPMAFMETLLARHAHPTPEALREAFSPLPGPMLCQATPTLKAVIAGEADPREVLRQGLLLGLCTAVQYDPGRPVLWTRTSLTRRLQLFDVSGFYA